MAIEMPDGTIGLTPEEGAAFYGRANEALMTDIAAAAKTHGLRAISVVAFTRDVGVLTFSTGADDEWREIARSLALKMGVDLGEMFDTKPRVVGPTKVRRIGESKR